MTKALKEHKFDEVARDFSFRSVDDLLSSVGYARLTPQKILRRLLPQKEPEPERTETQETREEAQRKSDGVRISGVDNVLVRYAKCCNPLPGDPIVGYISRGRGVTIHTMDCPNVQGMEPERLLSVFWEGEQDKLLPAKIIIKAKNEAGVLAEISGLLAEEKVNIDSGNFHSTVDGFTEINFTVQVRDAALLYKTLEKLNSLKLVVEASRSTSAIH